MNFKSYSQVDDVLITNLKSHVEYLSSTEMNGRFSGTPENLKAGEYIAGKFKEFGLKQFNSSYLQTFKYIDTLDAGKNTNIDFQVLIRKPGVPENMLKYRNKHWTAGKEYIPMRFSSNGKAESELVFCGYGVSAKDLGYDDYAGIDVKNKIVIVLADSAEGLPLEDYWFPYSDLSYKAENAAEHGAAAIIFVKVLHDSANVYYDFDVDWNYTSSIPAVHANRTEIALFFPKEQPLLKIEKEININKRPNSFVLPDVKISLAIELGKVEKDISNIVGYVEGTDANLKDEYIIVGANFDGFGAYWEQPKWRPKVWTVIYSADANASGTAALLELAKYYSTNPLKRSLIIVAFNCNVTGQDGSKYFVQNPPVPKEKIISMINLHSLGKMRDERLFVIGAGTGSNLNEKLNMASREDSSLTVIKGSKSIYPCDHLPFYNAGIPVLMLTTGASTDYGKASDMADKVSSKGLANALNFAEILTKIMANEPEKTNFLPDPALSDYKDVRRGYRCSLGIIPESNSDSKGVVVGDIFKNSAAEKNKFKIGDVIAKFNGKDIKNDYDLYSAESLTKPGDLAQITIIHDGVEKTINVKMEKRK